MRFPYPISEINLEDTGIRFEKHPSKLNISRSFICIFAQKGDAAARPHVRLPID